jgi:hypothetical protein
VPSGPGTILGGLPIIADAAFGQDWDGEYWSEVEHIYWMKKDGSAGKEIPAHIRDRAEKYDPYFSCLTEQISDHLAHEQSLKDHPESDSTPFQFTD